MRPKNRSVPALLTIRLMPIASRMMPATIKNTTVDCTSHSRTVWFPIMFIQSIPTSCDRLPVLRQLGSSHRLVISSFATLAFNTGKTAGLPLSTGQKVPIVYASVQIAC